MSGSACPSEAERGGFAEHKRQCVPPVLNSALALHSITRASSCVWSQAKPFPVCADAGFDGRGLRVRAEHRLT
eukprot:5731692-Pleurochrysis_carterae.AAC.1